MSNKLVIEFVRNQLGTNPNWAQRAIVKLWERQTADEQAVGMTHNTNGVGFNGTDAGILSSFAEQIQRGRTLSVKQLAIAHKKLPKYTRQVVSMISEEKLKRIEERLCVTA